MLADNWAISASDYEWVRTNFIADRANIAHSAGKPIIMEESGMKTGYLPSRNAYLANIYEWANENNYAGTLVWQVYAWYSLYPAQSQRVIQHGQACAHRTQPTDELPTCLHVASYYHVVMQGDYKMLHAPVQCQRNHKPSPSPAKHFTKCSCSQQLPSAQFFWGNVLQLYMSQGMFCCHRLMLASNALQELQ